MTASISRYEWPPTPSTEPWACLPAAAAVAISSLIGPDILTPQHIIQKYEETIHGPIPSTGATTAILLPMIRSAYNIDVHQPDRPYGWNLARMKRIVDAGIPLMVTYTTFWDQPGWVPRLFHAATVWDMPNEQIFIYDQDRRRDSVWTYDQFHWLRAWDPDRQWYRSLDLWSGWAFAFTGLGAGIPL